MSAEIQRQKEIPPAKLEKVEQLRAAMRTHCSLLIASTRKLPSSQFHEIKKKMRGKAEIAVAKKSLILRAIDATQDTALQLLKEHITADIALFFSNLDVFELAGMLAESQGPAKAKTGDIVPEDIVVEPGPTELVAGPAISELSSVGLKVAVEGGKLTIKQQAVIAKKGEAIKENVANVMGKLGIMPLRVGFEPLAAYDAKEHKVYVGIRIDKKGVLEALRDTVRRALGFTVNVKYPSVESVKYFIARAGLEEKVLQAVMNMKSGTSASETPAPTTDSTTTREGN